MVVLLLCLSQRAQKKNSAVVTEVLQYSTVLAAANRKMTTYALGISKLNVSTSDWPPW